MMSSVIPARLQFQCGHAALVTLPRVKGESATQRNDRVAREKTAALSRQCDFCAPSVAVNGNHADAALSDVVEPTALDELTMVVTSEAESPSETEEMPSETEPAVVPSELVIAEVIESEPGEVELPEELVIEAIIASHTEEPPAPEPKPARKPRARRQPRTPAARTPAPSKPARARRAPARRATPRPTPASSGQRFRVEYVVERAVRGATIQDVLRQLTGLGAVDVVAVTREG